MVITHAKDSRGFDLRSLLESSARIGITVMGFMTYVPVWAEFSGFVEM